MRLRLSISTSVGLQTQQGRRLLMFHLGARAPDESVYFERFDCMRDLGRDLQARRHPLDAKTHGAGQILGSNQLALASKTARSTVFSSRALCRATGIGDAGSRARDATDVGRPTRSLAFSEVWKRGKSSGARRRT